MESLFLLVLIAALAAGLLSGYGAGLHRFWTEISVRMQAALVQAHLAQL